MILRRQWQTDPNQFINPGYNHPENYTEKQVTFGEEPFTLPGVLTLPKGDGPFPVVVLVHGSGAHDMDETVFSFKPFRDLAVGLANHGIAVLRYDKRTHTHAIKSSRESQVLDHGGNSFRCQSCGRKIEIHPKHR